MKNICCLSCVGFMACVCSAHAEELFITSLDDSGPGTLRELLSTVQEGDIFNFQSDLSGTLFLQSSLPVISAGVMIHGPPDNVVMIDGADQYQIFKITTGMSTISELRLVNEAPTLGGAIWLQPFSTLSLKNVSVDECNGGGCFPPIYVESAAELRTQNCWMSNITNDVGKSIFFGPDGQYVVNTDDSIQSELTIIGSTVLKKQGNGMVEFYATSPVDVQMMIEQGTLSFNGTTVQPIIVGVGGKLQGNLSCFYLVNDGVVSPGNSIGVMSTVGDYFQMGRLEIELSPSGQADLLQVGNNAFLDGELLLVPQLGLYLKGDAFTILTTGGSVSGNFLTTSATLDLGYGLQYARNSVQVEVLKNSVTFFGSGFTGSTEEVLSTLENATVTRGSDLFSVLTAINALDSSSAAKNGLNQLGPNLFASIAWSDATTLYQLNEIVSSQQFSFCDGLCALGTLCDASCCPERKSDRIWLSVIGEKTQQDTVDSLIGFRTYTEGALVGYNRRLSDPVTIGGYGGYTHSNLSWRDSAQKGKTATNSGYASLYSTFCWKYFQMDASLLGSFYEYGIERKIDFPGIDREAKSSPHGFGLLGHLGVGSAFSAKTANFFPFAKFDYISIWQSRFKEHGADSINLSVESTNPQFIHAEAGMFVSRPFCLSWGSLTPSAGLSWVYLGPTAGTEIEGRFVSIPAEMRVPTTKSGFNAVSPMLGLGCVSGERWWISATYKGEFSSDRTEQDINLNVRYQF